MVLCVLSHLKTQTTIFLKNICFLIAQDIKALSVYCGTCDDFADK